MGRVEIKLQHTILWDSGIPPLGVARRKGLATSGRGAALGTWLTAYHILIDLCSALIVCSGGSWVCWVSVWELVRLLLFSSDETSVGGTHTSRSSGAGAFHNTCWLGPQFLAASLLELQAMPEFFPRVNCTEI